MGPIAMLPLFFGLPEQRLYGVSYGADPEHARGLGVVLCAPALNEAEDAHRALRGLAERLCRAGLDVLRFDYRGTGQSAGDAELASLAGWTDDVRMAVAELRASRGLSRVGLVGLRLGASLAWQAAAGADFLVLWEPVVDGAAHLTELRTLQRDWLVYEAQERPRAPRLAGDDEIMGCLVGEQLSCELKNLDLLSGTAPDPRRVLILDEGAQRGLDGLAGRLAAAGVPCDHEQLSGGRIWRRAFDAEQAPVPARLLGRLAAWILDGPPS